MISQSFLLMKTLLTLDPACEAKPKHNLLHRTMLWLLSFHSHFPSIGHAQHRAEMRLRRHHLFIGLARLLQREYLDHRTNIRENAEADSRLHLSDVGERSLDRVRAHEEVHRRPVKRRIIHGSNDQFAVRAQAAEQKRNDLAFGVVARITFTPPSALSASAGFSFSLSI